MEYARTATLVPELERKISVKENDIAFLAGEYPQVIHRSILPKEVKLPESLPVGLPSTLLERRPDVREAEQRLIASNAAVGMAFTNLFPRITLTANYGLESKQMSDFFKLPIHYLGANLLGPLFAMGKNRAMLKAQKANVKNEQMRAVWADEIINVNKNTRSTDCGSPSEEEKNKSFTGSANPRTFIASIPALAEKAGLKREDLLVTTDVGQHQMWAAQYYPVEEPRTFLTSGSLGTMGFGLPAAIGAAIANPKKRVICFSGDGSIMMNIQELATLAENNLPVTVIVFENGTLGMVYQQQKYLFDKTYSASEFAASPDLLKIAEGFGIETADADKDADWYKKAFDEKRPNKPFFVRVRVDPEENVLPFVPGGKANIDSIRD